MGQGQRFNLKFTVADVDRIAGYARSHWTAENICMELRGTRLESSPAEIVRLAELGVHVAHRRHA